MPSPEQRPNQPPEGKPEQEKAPYYKAARFRGEQPAGRAYFQAQDAIFNDPDCDLSAYRFQIRSIYHVAVLGEPPPEDLEQKLQTILSTGEPVSLPANLLKLLAERREQASNQAPWIERHYRPGKNL